MFACLIDYLIDCSLHFGRFIHFNSQARALAACRSTSDLAHHLSKRLTDEMRSNEVAGDARLEALSSQLVSLSQEFQQLEMLARVREQQLRDDR